MLPVIAVILVNITGFLLKYNALDRYIIAGGFRFHLSLMLPFFIILLNNDNRKILKEYLADIKDRKYLLSISFVVIPAAILFLVLFILRSSDIADPDYFYELGLTSVIDFPVYFFWNLPQLLMLVLFLFISSRKLKYKMPVNFILLITLFIYEFIPLNKGSFTFIEPSILLLAALGFTIFQLRVKNIYLFALVIFSSLWIDVLMFGSNSSVLVKMLLAKTYNEWGGFFEVNKNYYAYIMIGHFSIALIYIVISLMFNSKPKEQNLVSGYQMEKNK